MKREEKLLIIDKLSEKINNATNFYLADISELNAGATSELRRNCFKSNIELVVAKNTLLRKAFEKSNKEVGELTSILAGHTSVMISDVGNVPAKLIKDFRRVHKKPILKGAYIGEAIYIGDDQLDALVKIKSKEELVADIIFMLQSPIRQVMSSLQSGSNIITGVLETLSNKEEK